MSLPVPLDDFVGRGCQSVRGRADRAQSRPVRVRLHLPSARRGWTSTTTRLPSCTGTCRTARPTPESAQALPGCPGLAGCAFSGGHRPPHDGRDTRRVVLAATMLQGQDVPPSRGSARLRPVVPRAQGLTVADDRGPALRPRVDVVDLARRRTASDPGQEQWLLATIARPGEHGLTGLEPEATPRIPPGEHPGAAPRQRQSEDSNQPKDEGKPR